jgi:hypothetical protein
MLAPSGAIWSGFRILLVLCSAERRFVSFLAAAPLLLCGDARHAWIRVAKSQLFH